MIESRFLATDKPIMGSGQSDYQAEDSAAMARIVFGDACVDENVVMTAIFNGNPPLVWDQSQLVSMRVNAAASQAMLNSPFVLFGAATFRSPEVALMMYVFGLMARLYGIPWRTNGAKTGSKNDDLYVGYDSIVNVYPAILGGCNLLTHCGGTIEGSLCISMAKVGPGGPFFDEDYTHEQMPFLDELQDIERYETWKHAGCKDATTRRREWGRRMLERYEEEPPTLDPAIAETRRWPPWIAARRPAVRPSTPTLPCPTTCWKRPTS